MRDFTKSNIEFESAGLTCRGWLYIPKGDPKIRFPAVVMAHGFAGVKEMGLAGFADRFASAGYVTLAFDYRCWGESEGEPRNQIFALDMVEDYRNAVTWISDLNEVDSERVGVWGTSYSGGLVLYAGTFDRRIKAVVAQVPSALNPLSRQAKDPETWDYVGKLLIQDRIERYNTQSVKYINVVAGEGEPCVLPGREAYEEYMELKKLAPNWKNEVTLESLEKMREFDPVSLISLMHPTALLLIPGEKDTLIPIETVKALYKKAAHPKAMQILPISHFEIYREPWLSKASDLAVDWFDKYL